MDNRDESQLEPDEVDDEILDHIALTLTGRPSTKYLANLLGCKSVAAFCMQEGCRNLVEFFFNNGSFFGRLREIESRLSHVPNDR